ncbi:hypothetical protein ACC691_39560, partial [Rhizobium johnstonii]|uniref:hypothetical protein n=1 Tax=Rhizobium johnstonii TaxID=3019933 RepID=UPI003F94FE40
VRRLILSVGAGALIVVQEVVGYLGAALPTPWTLTHTIVHTLTGLTYAVCAWIAWQSSASPIPGRIMVLIAFIWLPPPFIATTAPIE